MSEETVTIRYFAAVRERAGCATEEIELEACLDEATATLDGVWREIVERHPEMEGLRDHVRLARNRDFVDGEVPVEAGDEIAVIPPVSGGSGEARDGGSGLASRRDGRFAVTDAPLDREGVRGEVVRSAAGAVVLFEGVVRDHTDDRAVAHLEYECYVEMAADKLVETADRAAEKWPDVEVAIHHRYGHLEVGETAVVIAVSSPPRAEAFEACRWCIDHLKQEVPIWKKEVGPEGEEWVGWGP